MRRILVLMFTIICIFSLVGCGSKNVNETSSQAAQTVQKYPETDTDLKTYIENKDGTWQCGEYTYKYKIEIEGRMPNAACNTTFVYLSNLETISFEQAWKAAGFSSNTEDYFDVEDAVLVEIETDD